MMMDGVGGMDFGWRMGEAVVYLLSDVLFLGTIGSIGRVGVGVLMGVMTLLLLLLLLLLGGNDGIWAGNCGVE